MTKPFFRQKLNGECRNMCSQTLMEHFIAILTCIKRLAHDIKRGHTCDFSRIISCLVGQEALTLTRYLQAVPCFTTERGKR